MYLSKYLSLYNKCARAGWPIRNVSWAISVLCTTFQPLFPKNATAGEENMFNDILITETFFFHIFQHEPPGIFDEITLASKEGYQIQNKKSLHVSFDRENFF